MSDRHTADTIRTQTKDALKDAHISQAEAARQLGLSTKHMSHMLTGRATLTLDWADRILAICGTHLELVTAQDKATDASPRIPLDDLTSDALDQLYEQLEARRTIIRSNVTKFRSWARRIRDLEAHATELEQRAERAEAANERVRKLATRLEEFAENALRVDDSQLYAALATDLRTALDAQPTT
ncbi:helix-turn-helix domain-containing protein [Streptomyces sp. NPDC005780]|uniref:helix-turn-helix domain-containing protein n=1 Tax=Streptomyces sp. NPDC005780 TaxID=3364730 RepID=UPI0036AC22E9